MALIDHETIIAAPITQVWLFFTDPVKNLPRISHPSAAIVVKSADLPIKDGSGVVIACKDPFGRRIDWQSRIEEFTPPHPVVFGMEARFVDIQVSGPFRIWKHEHEFEAIDLKTTRVVDRVTYMPPAGFLGLLADWLFLRWHIKRVLKYRGRMLKEILTRQ